MLVCSIRGTLCSRSRSSAVCHAPRSSNKGRKPEACTSKEIQVDEARTSRDSEGILKFIGTRSLAFGRTESDWDGTRVINMEVQNDEILWAGSRPQCHVFMKICLLPNVPNRAWKTGHVPKQCRISERVQDQEQILSRFSC